MKLEFARRLGHAVTLLLACLREIFDESAYQRFLGRNQRPPSRQTYSAFLKESEGVKAGRPRCC